MTVDPQLFLERRPDRAEALALAALPAAGLMPVAAALRDRAHGERISFSRKVFIPLTRLCRDVCHYCTFAQPPRTAGAAYLSPDEVLAIARAGAAAGCREALFTLGDRPELRYRAAREALDRLGHASTLDYLAAMAELVFAETGLLPHLNPGLMSAAEIARLRPVAVSMGIMLEGVAPALSAPGGPHHGSPDKDPAARLRCIADAGAAQVPFTSGILIGIGEDRRDRIAALLALRDIDDAHGHLQEVIVQNFRAKPGTRMAGHPEPDLEEQLWSIAAARLVLGPQIHLQTPPNLRADALGPLIAAGIDDWGGVSPVTPDHVNPEAPWPELDRLAAETRAAGHELVERLAVYPRYAAAPERWLDRRFHRAVRAATDAGGLVRENDWVPGRPSALPQGEGEDGAVPADLARLLSSLEAGVVPDEAGLIRLFQARGAGFRAVCAAADRRRAATAGATVRYVVTRNINYTNICGYRCGFCAFSKGRAHEHLRGRPYRLDLEEVGRRVAEAWERGATEVCLQGGIHPEFTGNTYLSILQAVRDAAPGIHIHAFSPLEVSHGAATLGLSLPDYLARLKAAGLGSLPGTAAEILDDEVRQVICPDKLDTAAWLAVMRAAHGVGLRSTATVMFGHVDGYRHWARHLLRLRGLQAETGGFTELVPLPFVHMEAPIFLKGGARQGPTWREAVLMHAVARLALDPLIPNIQTSWVKMGPDGAAACLAAGANDMGGTLMDESITRAAGAGFGQEMGPAQMERLIREAGRVPALRSTLYGPVPGERRHAAFAAAALDRSGHAAA